jgi:DNA-damage-inducible protein J
MTNTTIQARINPKLKAEADAIFAAIGLKTSDAIRMFLKQTVNEGGLPFKPSAKVPNKSTIAAMEEDIKGLKSYQNADELFKDLGM